MTTQSVQVESGDRLPACCVVCGSEATDSCMVCCRVPLGTADKVAGAASIGAFLMGLMTGFLVFFQSPRRSCPDRWWLTLPTCQRHASVAEVQNVVQVVAVNHRIAQLTGASDAFRRAVAQLQAQRPALNVAAMAQSDRPPPDTRGFLGNLTKEPLSDAHDYLRGLEGRGHSK